MVLRGIYKFPSCSMPHIYIVELYAKQATTNDEVEKVKKVRSRIFMLGCNYVN